MSALQAANIRADLYQYLAKRHAFVSAEFLDVLEDVTAFTAAIVRDGLRETVTRLSKFVNGIDGRPFVEMADAIVEHHTRLVQGPDREIIRKSLLEAYIHAAGPQYVFGLAGKTRLVRSLRQFGAERFAALIFSLHLFNVISLAIQDEVRENAPDAKTFELYMLGLETICRDAVKAALSTEAAPMDKKWAQVLAKNVELQLSQKTVTVG